MSARTNLPVAIVASLCASCGAVDRRDRDAPPAPAVAPSSPAQPARDPRSAPAPAERCDADAAAPALGEPFTEALAERARALAGATVVRAIRPGQSITLEFLAERLNLRLDATGRVVDIACG